MLSKIKRFSAPFFFKKLEKWYFRREGRVLKIRATWREVVVMAGSFTLDNKLTGKNHENT